MSLAFVAIPVIVVIVGIVVLVVVCIVKKQQSNKSDQKKDTQLPNPPANIPLDGGSSYISNIPPMYSTQTQYYDPPSSSYPALNIDFNRQLEWGEFLGSGGFGEVYRAKYTRLDGQQVDVAVKIPHQNQFLDTELPQNKNEQQQLLQELSMMSEILHPNVVKCYGGCLFPRVAIVMEFVGGGDLYNYLHNRQYPLTYEEFFRIAIGLAAGFQNPYRISFYSLWQFI
eukprot:TRINITY_DN8194_c0_g1_i1.p1 TRINITY_DN8194_c0_g1~~TRINITY_DN8194_c0_g1_i1.p1  ORF type:complete len:226 (-),score=21.75 TRINITY_DN8194_c0_g1_i1:50-727(-)